MERALHDLLGALSSLRLWEEILRSSNGNRVQQGEALAAIRGSTVEMTRIVYDMLDVARARSGRLQLASEPIAIDRIADGAIEEARGRGLAIDSRIAPALWIRGDASRIRQALDRMLLAVGALTIECEAITFAMTLGPREVVLDIRAPRSRADVRLPTSIESEIAAEIVRLHGGTFVEARDGVHARLPALDLERRAET